MYELNHVPGIRRDKNFLDACDKNSCITLFFFFVGVFFWVVLGGGGERLMVSQACKNSCNNLYWKKNNFLILVLVHLHMLIYSLGKFIFFYPMRVWFWCLSLFFN